MDKAMDALVAMGFSSTSRHYEQIGWLGHGASSTDHFRCEFCGAESHDCTEIEHSGDCAVVLARIAVGNVTEAAE